MADPERLVLDPHGDLLTFHSLDALNVHARSQGFDVEPIAESMALDLDAIEAWCADPNADAVDCGRFIEAWNMMDDVLLTLGRSKLLHDGVTAHDDGVYMKLFWGTNPRALMADHAEDLDPSWTDDQIEIIVTAFRHGLRDFRSILRT